MATRNLTRRFEELRSACRHPTPRPTFSKASDGQESLLGDDSRNDAQYVLPPKWVDIVETVQRDIVNVKELLTQLDDKHNARLQVSFAQNEAEIERDIDMLTQRITQLMKKSENGVKRIATVANDRGTALPERERMVRLNVMRSLGAELQDLSKKFRKTQKSYLNRMRGQEEVGKQFFSSSPSFQQSTATLDEALERGLTNEEVQQLVEMNENASAREREIIQIAKSVNELSSLFNELSVLVVEQGTVLDRIDYNVEQTLFKVQEGVEELQKAEEYSKGAKTIKCILALIVVIIILTAILVFKHVNFSNGGEGGEGGGGGSDST